MSDEASTTANPRPDLALFVHYCENPGCTKWGSFGFAVGRAEPNWFCFEHRPDWKARPTTRPC
ncbi:hypothetical protein ILFOPFJJ_05458 [Ensifer psoraleae]|uniref:hypothetical protein n=1 Tax=Sinorhizobium psoraleae TaxID=520838 RepID=UPI001568765D|nr:hypothetical protein [Sinorhizobium psoraleae]NRP74536.1 hypothetical protein [Sinorhizobium psoraleae]